MPLGMEGLLRASDFKQSGNIRSAGGGPVARCAGSTRCGSAGATLRVCPNVEGASYAAKGRRQDSARFAQHERVPLSLHSVGLLRMG